MKLKRDLILLFIYEALTSSMMFWNIFYVFYERVGGLSTDVILILSSVYYVGVVILEVPSGAVADRFKRKYSLVIGGLSFVLGTLLLLLFNHMVVFIISQLLFSAGMAFISCSNEAYLYDYLKSAKRDDEYLKYDGYLKSIGFLFYGIGGLLGGVFANFDIRLPYIVSCGISIAAVIVAMLISENKSIYSQKADERIEDKRSSRYLSIIRDCFIFILKNSYVKWFFLFYSFCIVSAHIFFELQQPYYNILNVPLYLFGVFSFIVSIIQTLMSSMLDRITKIIKPRYLLYSILLGYVSLLFLSGFMFGLIGVVFFILRGFMGGVYKTLTNNYIQSEVESRFRATLISFLSLSGRLIVSLVLVLIGFMISYFDINIVLLILSAIFLLFSVTLIIFKPSNI